MKLSELIVKLEDLKAKHGDLAVRVQTLTHMWDPEPVVRVQDSRMTVIEYVLLNP